MSEKPNNRKVGVIVLAVDAVEASWPELCRTLFARFCPFRTSLSPDGTRIAYTGFCDQFEELGPDEMPPRYYVSASFNNGVVATVNFTKHVPKPIEQPKAS